MAKFAQYYIEYVNDNLFSELEWENRQKLLGTYFETDQSIDFSLGEGDGRKTYKHNVYHLSSNKDIIIMRIANDKKQEVIQNFKKISVPHEPHAFVIIDNRNKCRRIAIQKNDSFNTTDSLKKIIQKVLDEKLTVDYNIGLKLHPQFYPKDFYKAWELRQYYTACIRFNLSEAELPSTFWGEELDDESIMDFAIKVNEEEMRKKYRPVLELNPPLGKTFLEVDYSSSYIRNLVKFHANTGASIELVTNDGSHFTCFINNDEESESIVINEIDSHFLDDLFPADGNYDDEEVKKSIAVAEGKIMEFINKMKVEIDNDNELKEMVYDNKN